MNPRNNITLDDSLTIPDIDVGDLRIHIENSDNLVDKKLDWRDNQE